MLEELARRVEQATGPDRELDGAIYSAIFPSGKIMSFLHYTASIDAARWLVPEDAFWRVGHDGEGADPALFKGQVLAPLHRAGNRIAVADTPALALTAAALRARAAMEGQNNG